MISRLARWIWGALLFVAAVGGVANAQTVLLDEVRTLSAGAAPVEHAFDITQAGSYRLVFTDLKFPRALTSGKLAVTRGTTVVGTANVDAINSTATLDFDATAGSYVVRVVGTPETGRQGNVGIVITRSGETASFNEFVATIAAPPVPSPSNQAVLEDAFTPSVAGSYEVVLTDAALPEALPDLLLSVNEPGVGVVAQLSAAGTTTFSAQAGVEYQIAVIGASSVSTNAGLFSVRVRPAGTSANIFSRTVPVGRVQSVGSVTLSAGAHVLSVNDLLFPSALTQKAASLLSDGALAVTGAAGDTPFTATAGDHLIYVAASAAASQSGSYGLEVRPSGGAPAFSTVKSVGGETGPTPAFTYIVDVPSAGAYRVRLADFGFPAAFSAVQVGASQDGSLLGTLAAAGTLNLPNVSTGKLFVVVIAAPAGTAGGVFGIDVAATSGGTPLFEATQGVGNLFQSRKVSAPGSTAFRVNITDVGFPKDFKEIGAIVTRGAETVGKVYNGGEFDFNASAGNYFITFIATADEVEKAGTYGIHVADKPPAPVVALTVTPGQVASGSAIDLAWTATNATSCLASGGWSGSRPVSGNEHLNNITTNATFKLECAGEGGTSSASASVTVTAQSDSGGGGGMLGWLVLGALAAVRCIPRRRGAAGAG
jgi:MYXO-CTERM domain-containing protein